MSWISWCKWLLFLSYTVGLCALAPAILWGYTGMIGGAALGIGFIFWIRVRGLERLSERLRARPIHRADASQLYGRVDEYCRRLKIPTPRLVQLPQECSNLAIYGFNTGQTTIALSKGLRDHLKSEQLALLIGHQLCLLCTGVVPLYTWLSQFLAPMDPIFSNERQTTHTRQLLAQLGLFPLLLIPILLLRPTRRAQITAQAARLTRKPWELARALRQVEISQGKSSLKLAFSVRHLFMVRPEIQPSLAKLFPENEFIGAEVRYLEGLSHWVSAK